MAEKNDSFDDFFELREARMGKMVKVAVRRMTRAQARKAYPYRPFSEHAESRFGGNGSFSDIANFIAGLALRCKMCDALTIKIHLVEGVCPDCDGRSEYNGNDPHKKI